MLFSELIAKIYSFEDNEDQLTLTTEAKNNFLNNEEDKLDTLPMSLANPPNLRRCSKSFSLKDNNVSRPMTNSLKETILNRKRFVFKISEIFNYIICCSMCKNKTKLTGKNRKRRHLLFKKGIKKVTNELDCVHVI